MALRGISLFALAFGFAAAAHAQAPGGPPPAVDVAKPLVQDVTESEEFIGRFDAVDQVDIRARVTGYVEKIAVKDGVLVKAGDVLFTIDKRPYQAALDQAKAAAASAAARVTYASGDLARAEDLRKSGNIAEQIFDQRRQTLQTARGDVDGFQAAVTTAQLNLDFTDVRAPISGRVSRRQVSPGNLVVANDTVLINVVSVDPVYFYFDVDEKSYLLLTKVPAGGLKTTGRNKVYAGLSDESAPTREGRLDFVDNKVDQSSGTMRARAVFDNPDGSLTPGLFGRIKLVASAPYKGMLAPEAAVGADQDRRIVVVLGPDNKAVARPVKLGPVIGGYRVIREGVTADDKIIVNGLMRARPGSVVTPNMVTLPPPQASASN